MYNLPKLLNHLPLKTMFIVGLVVGTLMSISSSTWFIIWAGLEINTMMFLPLISNKSKTSTEASIKYFFMSAISSTMIMFFVILLLMKNYQHMFSHLTMKEENLMMFIQLMLLMKLGVAPLHFWFPIVMESMSWTTSFIMMTWQKVAPLFILSMLQMTQLIIIICILSLMIGMWGGFNQLNIRKLLAFSSINHMAWNLIMIEAPYELTTYFSFYSFLILSFLSTITHHNISSISQISMFLNLPTLLFMSLFSLGGLPPLLGFFPKWLTLTYTLSNKMFITSTLMVITSASSMLYYMRIMYSMTLLNMNFMKWWKSSPPTKKMVFLGISNFLTLPVAYLMT